MAHVLSSDEEDQAYLARRELRVSCHQSSRSDRDDVGIREMCQHVLILDLAN